MTATTDAPRLLVTEDVAGLLLCSPRNVQRLVKDGAMPGGFKLNGLRRFNADEIAAWLAAGCPRVTAATN